MKYNKQISQLKTGDEIEGFYILKNAAGKTSTSGKPFLSGSLSDKSGIIDLKVWDYPGPISSSDEGSVVKIRGNVDSYRGSPQLVASRIRLIQEGDRFDPAALVPVAPIDTDAAWTELLAATAAIPDKDYRDI